MNPRLCAMCGRTFQPRRATARYCGSSCRGRASRLRSEGVDVAVTPGVPREGFDPELHPLVKVTRQTLEKAGVAETVLGLLALTLARQAVDPGVSAYGLVACIRGLEREVAAALASVEKPGWRDKKARLELVKKVDDDE